MARSNIGNGTIESGGLTNGATQEPPPPTNTLNTAHGAISWTQASDGTITAICGGQTLVVSKVTNADGSWQSTATYAKTGNAPYLTSAVSGSSTNNNASASFSSGSTQLVLTLSNVNASVTSGTATVSGTVKETAIHWTTTVDLTINPLVRNPITGWPKGVFANQLQAAALFSPLGNQFLQQVHETSGTGITHGVLANEAGTTLKADAPTPDGAPRKETTPSAGGVIGRAVSWCAGGAMAALPADSWTLGGASAAACVGGASASLLSDLATYIFDSPDVPVDPPPNFDIPTDPDPIDDGLDNQTSNDGSDGDNGSGSDGGSGDGSSGGDGGCFVAGTPVHTCHGRLPIEGIAIETQLLNCDEAGATNGTGTVTRLFNSISEEIVTVTFDNSEVVRCTPRHRFFTDSGWLAAGRMAPGIKVRSLDSAMRSILAVSIAAEQTPVFNMRVNADHTYFVGETGYLVHNAKDSGDDGSGNGGSTPDAKSTKGIPPVPVKPVTNKQ